MARLVVITEPDLVPGYRLAGANAVEAHDASQAASILERLLDEPDVAVIGVHGPYWEAIAPRFEERMVHRVLPVVIDIPSGGEAQQRSRRARLAAMLQQAVGQRITFRKERS
jgi:V/A-type H+-transporting ATPase subunit F